MTLSQTQSEEVSKALNGVALFPRDFLGDDSDTTKVINHAASGFYFIIEKSRNVEPDTGLYELHFTLPSPLLYGRKLSDCLKNTDVDSIAWKNIPAILQEWAHVVTEEYDIRKLRERNYQVVTFSSRPYSTEDFAKLSKAEVIEHICNFDFGPENDFKSLLNSGWTIKNLETSWPPEQHTQPVPPLITMGLVLEKKDDN